MTVAYTPAYPTPAPTPSRPRLGAIDTARALALFGMMMVNLNTVRSDGWFNAFWTLPFGRASILFVLLAGLGMSMFLRSRRRDPRRWPVLLWRATLFVAGGLALQLLTPAVSVILPTYGALFLGALLWRRLPDQALLGLAGVMLVLGPVLVQAHAIPVEHQLRMPTLGDAPGTLLHSLVLSGAYPLLVWVVPFLVGMWLGRQDLRDRRLHRRLAIGGGVAAVGGFVAGQLGAALLGPRAESGWWRLLTGVAHQQMPFWLISSIGSALLVLGALFLLWERLGHLAGPFVAAGQLALTFYVAHFLVIAAIGGRIDARAVGVPVTLGLAAVFTLFAVVWVRHLGVGPLERLLRARWLNPLTRKGTR